MPCSSAWPVLVPCAAEMSQLDLHSYEGKFLPMSTAASVPTALRKTTTKKDAILMVSLDQQHQIGFNLQENDIKRGKTTFQKILSVAAVGEVVK